MAVDKIVTLCKEDDSETKYYPNIKTDNIPDKAVTKGKLSQEVQDILDNSTPSGTAYTKEETNALLDLKADKSTTYTKTEVDTLLGNKANASDVYTKSQTYNQTEIDLRLENKQDVIDSSNKVLSDLIDDTNQTNKFVTATEKSQITTNATDITNIKDGTTIDSFGDVETALTNKQDKLYVHNVYFEDSGGVSYGNLLYITRSSNSFTSASDLYNNKNRYIGFGLGETAIYINDNPIYMITSILDSSISGAKITDGDTTTVLFSDIISIDDTVTPL